MAALAIAIPLTAASAVVSFFANAAVAAGPLPETTIAAPAAIATVARARFGIWETIGAVTLAAVREMSDMILYFRFQFYFLRLAVYHRKTHDDGCTTVTV
jgi:membrane protein DedA with SNARE-associated domain